MTASDDAGTLERRNGGSRPVPDPTELTDAAIAKAVNSLTQYIDGQLGIRDERLSGIDEATKLRHRASESISREIDEKVGFLKQLHSEKFDSIQTQFQERDTRSERESRDNKVAVDAAFAAQKEAAAKQDEANAKAIDKSEKATAETIKTNQDLNASKTDALTKGLDEVKLAVAAINANKVGGAENRTGLYAAVGVIATIVFLAIAVAGILATRTPA